MEVLSHPLILLRFFIYKIGHCYEEENCSIMAPSSLRKNFFSSAHRKEMALVGSNVDRHVDRSYRS